MRFIWSLLILSFLTPSSACWASFKIVHERVNCQALLLNLKGLNSLDEVKEARDTLRRFRQITIRQPNNGPSDKPVLVSSKEAGAKSFEAIGRRVEAIEALDRDSEKETQDGIVMGGTFVGDDVAGFLAEINQTAAGIHDQLYQEGSIARKRMKDALAGGVLLAAFPAIVVPFGLSPGAHVEGFYAMPPMFALLVAFYSAIKIPVESFVQYVKDLDTQTHQFQKRSTQILSEPMASEQWLYFGANQRLLKRNMRKILADGVLTNETIESENRKATISFSERWMDLLEEKASPDVRAAKTFEEKKKAMKAARERLGHDDVWVMSDFLLDSIETDGTLTPRLTLVVRITDQPRFPPKKKARAGETFLEKMAHAR